jgi:hypothetical protein
MTAWFALLPVLTLVFAAVAGYPGGADPAPVRLALIRGALVTGAFGVLSVEALSLMHQLSPGPIRSAWALTTAVTGILAARRARVIGRPSVSLGLAGWAMTGGLAALALAELVVALVAAPNNVDSLSYHLPRIENWAQNRSVAFYPTSIHRQAGTSPGAEYLLTHLRLLAGPEEFFNLLQWAAALGCAMVVSRIALQLGAGRAGQLLAAATVLTAPLVTLEATSTQTDLVVAFWVACGASLAVAGLRTRTGWAHAGWLGLATGLTAVTKVNGVAVLVPFLALWVVGNRWRPAIGGGAAILAVAALLAGPFTIRAALEWDDPAGDPAVQAIALGRHDPAAVTVNGVRIAATVLSTPSDAVNSGMVRAADGMADLLHIKADDPRLVFGGGRFTSVAPPYPDEDHAAYPIQALAVLVAVGIGILRRRPYAVAAAASLVLTAALIAWQPWVNRLILPTFVAGAPLVGQLAVRSRRAIVAVTAVVLVAGTQAAYTVWAGQPRPLGTVNSVLAVSREQDRYVRERDREAPYQAAAQRVAASGARRVGLIQSNVGWEYAWWVELRRAGVRPVIVSLDSALRKHPAQGFATVDVALCTLDAPDCARRAPPRWTVVGYPGVSVLLPPGR